MTAIVVTAIVFLVLGFTIGTLAKEVAVGRYTEDLMARTLSGFEVGEGFVLICKKEGKEGKTKVDYNEMLQRSKN